MSEAAASDRTPPPLRGTLPPACQRDVATLRGFIRTLVRDESPAAPVSPDDFREVLLTGATGFIGRFFLRDLLQRDSGLTVHCLVRTDSEEDGWERLRTALTDAGLWDDTFASRIRVVPGDIGAARLGLSEPHFSDLCQRIDAVYHLAADINLTSSYIGVRKLNTLSLGNVVELCVRRRFKHLFHASTMAVFPEYFFAFAREFRDHAIGHQMQPDLASMKRRFPVGFLGYPWSKLTAEQVLLFAQQAGMPLAIFRLPQTAVSSTGYVQPNDLTMKILGAVLDCESLPDGFTFRSNHEVVDTLSQACTAISRNSRRRFTIYHCCNPQLDYYELELADFGVYFPRTSYEAFKRACHARGDRSPLHGSWALLDHFGEYWFSREKPVDRLPICDRAFREDCPHPIRWPGVLTKLRRSYWRGQENRKDWPYPASHGELDFARLIERAEHYAQDCGVHFDQAYPPWMRQNLKQLVRALQGSDARLLENTIVDTAFDLSRLLVINAGITRERQRYPEIEREEIKRPVFIVGINRTGTTYLHCLMSRDPRFWALRGYEFAAPRLSKNQYATIGCTADDPRRLWVEDMLRSSDAVGLFEGVHDFNVDEPSEDFPILSMAFASWTLLARYRIPEFGDWLSTTGSHNAYAHHRRIMQNYTWQRRQRPPGRQRQWLFKMPFHLMELETLIRTYPDALFIQTHREPARFMGSWNSFVERAHSLAYEPEPRASLGAGQLAFMSGMMDRAVRFREAHPELEGRWADVDYAQLVKDPLAVVRGIYRRFDWPLPGAAVTAMKEWLSVQAAQRRKEPPHRYDLADYGLTANEVNAAFAGYRNFVARNGIPGFDS